MQELSPIHSIHSLANSDKELKYVKEKLSPFLDISISDDLIGIISGYV